MAFCKTTCSLSQENEKEKADSEKVVEAEAADEKKEVTEEKKDECSSCKTDQEVVFIQACVFPISLTTELCCVPLTFRADRRYRCPFT